MKLSLKDLSLSFSHKQVLNDLTIEMEGGQVYALLGNNGAGKSTLANIICGELKPDRGTGLLDDRKITFGSPAAARKNGIFYVHQIPLLSEQLNVIENIKIGLTKKELKKTDSYIKKWLPELKKNTPIKNVSADNRFFIALVNSLLHDPEILILDEPTALLDEKQRKFLFDNLKALADKGKIILVISHNLEEVKAFCNKIFFLQDGKIKTAEKEELGTGLYEKTEEEKTGTGLSSEKLRILYKNLTAKPKDGFKIQNLNFECIGGQVSVIKGNNEDGLLTLEKVLIAGDLSPISGTIEITNETAERKINLERKKVTPFILRNTLDVKISIVPTDRTYTASNPELTVKEVLTEGLNKEPDFCRKLIERAEVNINEDEKTSNLSGGMLQRLIIERELEKEPDFLICCHPMQGLAPEICCKIEKRIRQIACKGTAVLVLTAGDFIGRTGDRSFILKNGAFVK